MKKILFENKWFAFLLLGLAVFLIYSPAFKSGFLPWDDHEYVTENADIKGFTVEHLKTIFSRSYLGNYQPVSMLTYMLDFKMGGEEPFWYHFNNLVFHFLNGILVLLLIKKITGKQEIAFVSALIFLVHPVQAESVMWIAERKNLVYVFFFLLASLAYFNFKEKKKTKFYLFALLLFCLSLLSKGTAVAFPLCLIAYDVMRGEKFSKQNILEKIPFFALSIGTGILTIFLQKKDGFLNEAHNFDFFTKILNGSYAFCIYLYKILIPVSLSSYYPFPEKTGIAQILCFVFVLVFFVGMFLLFRKKLKRETGALLFFGFNIVFVLQFVPFGEVLVAERYNYLGCLGIILFFALLIDRFLQAEPIASKTAAKKTPKKSKSNSIIKSTFAGLVIVIFSFLCFKRNQTWKDSFTLYGDILKKFPDAYPVMSSLGAEYMRINDFEKAHSYFNKAIKKKPKVL
ncbi:MAG: glycosyltransferase family 39 protein [Bacteroidia bacterium]|nr:glycosyltransferase family 39 protein [Bacteroidia bacterium]